MRPLSSNHTIAGFRADAMRSLPRAVFDFIDGGAGDERGLSRNVEAFNRITLRPRIGVDTSHASLATEVLGEACAAPFGIAPLGLTGLVRPDADLLLARAAADAGIPFMLSACASNSVAAVTAAAGRPPWFQFYMPKSGAWSAALDRIEGEGCPVLVLTMDVPVPGKRLRDLRNDLRLPFRPGLLDRLRFPRWQRQQAQAGAWGFPNLLGGDGASAAKSFSELMASQTGGAMGWEQVAAMRDAWPRKLVLKGVLSVEDAVQALALGVDAVIVSNHGGRQLDCAPAPVTVLGEFARAGLPPRAVLLDSGVRSGEDVAKGLCLGAGAVFLGRPFLYALAAHGMPGIERLIELLFAETGSCLRLLGASSVDALHAHGNRRSQPAHVGDIQEQPDRVT